MWQRMVPFSAGTHGEFKFLDSLIISFALRYSLRESHLSGLCDLKG